MFQAEPAASEEVLRLEQVWQGLPMQLGCGEQADSGLRYSERNGQARWLGACELRGEAVIRSLCEVSIKGVTRSNTL